MKLLKFWLLPVLLTLFGVTNQGWATNDVGGTDGSICVDSDNARIPLSTRGTWMPVGCYNVCDGITDADYDDDFCNQFDLGAVGIPDLLVFEYEEDPDNKNCNESPGPTVTITTGPVSRPAADLDSLGIPSYDISTSAVILTETNNRVAVITKDAMLDRFLWFAVANTNNCTAGAIDVRMFLYNRKPS